MKRHTIPLVMTVLTLAIILLPAAASAQDAGVTGAGAGALPVNTLLNAVSVSGLQFGMGVYIPGDGSAQGQFQATLLGLSLLGLPQNIEVEGQATTGSSPTGSRTFSGTATVDMGDGLPPLTNVPFTVTATSTTLVLILGLTNLPAATLTAGTIAIQ